MPSTALRAAGELADDARLIGKVRVGAKRLDAGQHAVADAGCRSARRACARHDEDAGRLAHRFSSHSTGSRRARRRLSRSMISRPRRAAGCPAACSFRRDACDQAVFGQALQEVLERDAVGALDAEGAGDLALAGGCAGAVVMKVENCPACVGSLRAAASSCAQALELLATVRRCALAGFSAASLARCFLARRLSSRALPRPWPRSARQPRPA